MKQHQLTFRLNGIAPLLMHNGSLADPFNPITKEMKKVSGKRKKVDSDFEEMARLEFLGGLYVNKEGRPIIPGILVESAIINGAKKDKNGGVFKSGVFCEGDFLLKYKGPATAEALEKDASFRLTCGVKVGQARIMRTRPMFSEWSVEVVVTYMPDVVDKDMVIQAIKKAGELVGLGDWRPRFGRFDVEIVK